MAPRLRTSDLEKEEIVFRSTIMAYFMHTAQSVESNLFSTISPQTIEVMGSLNTGSPRYSLTFYPRFRFSEKSELQVQVALVIRVLIIHGFAYLRSWNMYQNSEFTVFPSIILNVW